MLEFDVLPSTSTYAREKASTLRLPSLIIANSQTNGRGRQGKSFYSPAESGLYMTLAFESDKVFPLITPAAAVAVCETIEEFSEIRPQIKWVNDIFYNSKKVCGILSELIKHNGKNLFLIGIGINLTTADFPEDLDCAGSLDKALSKKDLAENISKKILTYAESPDNEKVVSEYRKRLFIIGREITFSENGIGFTAKVKSINEWCNLITELPDGTEKILSSGEISIKI